MKPTETLGWAVNQVDETATVNGNLQAVTNKIEVTSQLKNSGWLAGEPIARPYLNWLFDYLMRWVGNLDERTSFVGKIEMTTDAAKTITNYSEDFGGVWEKLTDETLGGKTVHIFERTS